MCAADRAEPERITLGAMVGAPPRATVPAMQRRWPATTRGIRTLEFVGCLSTGLLALSVACDRNIEAFEPGEEPSPPDLARIFPAPAGGIAARASEGAAGASVADAGRGQPARGALPPSRAESGAPPEEAATDPLPPIEGVIEIAPDLAARAPDGAILFVIARPVGARGGPPLAVLRIPEPRFPVTFAIGPDDVMIPTLRFAGPISLSARLDADGNAMTRGAGDVSSVALEPLEPGTTGVALRLDQET